MDKLAICNSALRRCGAEAIASLVDTSKRAVAVVAQYDITLKELLNDSPWNFAIKRDELAVDATAPEYGFTYRYALPADCVRILELEDKEEYRVEAGYIVCNTDEAIKVKYVYLNEDPTKYSGAFIKALSIKLAEDISYLLVQSAALQSAIAQEAERYLRKARSMNSQEGTPEGRYPEDFVFGARQ